MRDQKDNINPTLHGGYHGVMNILLGEGKGVWSATAKVSEVRRLSDFITDNGQRMRVPADNDHLIATAVITIEYNAGYAIEFSASYAWLDALIETRSAVYFFKSAQVDLPIKCYNLSTRKDTTEGERLNTAYPHFKVKKLLAECLNNPLNFGFLSKDQAEDLGRHIQWQAGKLALIQIDENS